MCRRAGAGGTGDAMSAVPPAPADDVTLTFGGNATTLLRIGGFTVLTDPNFLRRGQRAYLGKGLWTKRLTDPALLPTQLPALDAILLSHLHADHWDRIATATLDKDTPVVTTPEAAKALDRRGSGRRWTSRRGSGTR
jgi:L-ascorbate metabolism protein UlaG (beta-lactamase superfamily)